MLNYEHRKKIWLFNTSKIYNEEGVDLTLIQWMLSLSPTERLRLLQANINFIIRLKNAKRIV